MTREEAKEILSDFNLCHYTPSREAAEAVISALDPLEIISALRPVSREQVEKVRGEWKRDKWPSGTHRIICNRCGEWNGKITNFCPHCGAPMTDKAVEMVMEKWEALHEEN